MVVEVVKKLFKVEMNTAKEAAVRIVSGLVSLVPQS